MVGQGYVLMVGEVEVVFDYVLTYLFQNFLVFSLVDHPVEIFMLKGNEINFVDAEQFLGDESGYRFCLCDCA